MKHNILLERKAIEKLKIAETKGTEEGHYEADKILCELLNALGYSAFVKEYEKQSKWYS